MRFPDHFHAMVELADGSMQEVEGGWTGYPRGWEDMHFLRQEHTLVRMADAWSAEGYLNIKKLRAFRLAG